MVYNIIKQHHGFINVESFPAKGTTFSIFLPIHEEKQEKAVSEPQTNQELIKHTGKVLVIDDEEVIRLTAQAILEESGYTVFSSAGGTQGIEMYKEEKFDIVILDMSMPEMSGYETFEELKKIDPSVKVLLASGFKKDERVQTLLDKGVSGFIQKPYTAVQLSKKVAEFITKKPTNSTN